MKWLARILAALLRLVARPVYSDKTGACIGYVLPATGKEPPR